MDMEYREASEEDLPGIIELEIESMGAVWDEEDIEYNKQTLEEFITQRLGHDRMIVIEDGGEIIGYLHSITYQDVVSDQLVREIAAITIHPEHFGEGLGGELIERERKNAADDGVDIMKLEVISANERAVKFYERHGFKELKKVMTRDVEE